MRNEARSWLVCGTAVLALMAAAGSALAEEEGRRDFTFSGGTEGVTLSGSVRKPAAPVAGAVLLPGSGPAVRAQLEPLMEELAARGIATLAFDKRGCGESGGSWMRASLQDLAADARAAVRELRRIPELEGKAVGLWGHSQGVWVATVAASEDPSIAFLAAVGGGGVSPKEAETFQYAGALRHAGVSEADRERGLELVGRYFAYLETGEGRAKIASDLEAHAGETWLEALGLERILVSEEGRQYWSWVATFDPRPLVERFTIPVLAVFGEQDRVAPVPRSIEAWSESLARAPGVDLTIRVFPEADHGLRVGAGHGGHGASGPWAPGYLDALAGWISSRSNAQ